MGATDAIKPHMHALKPAFTAILPCRKRKVTPSSHEIGENRKCKAISPIRGARENPKAKEAVPIHETGCNSEPENKGKGKEKTLVGADDDDDEFKTTPSSLIPGKDYKYMPTITPPVNLYQVLDVYYRDPPQKFLSNYLFLRETYEKSLTNATLSANGYEYTKKKLALVEHAWYILRNDDRRFDYDVRVMVVWFFDKAVKDNDSFDKEQKGRPFYYELKRMEVLPSIESCETDQEPKLQVEGK